MHDEAFRAQGSEQVGSLITSTWSKMIPPEFGHGRMLEMNLHEKLVDDVSHLRILQPSLQYRPFGALDIHLHDHSVGRGEVQRLFSLMNLVMFTAFVASSSASDTNWL